MKKEKRLDSLRSSIDVVAKLAARMRDIEDGGWFETAHKKANQLPDDDPEKAEWVELWGVIEGLLTLLEASANLCSSSLVEVRESKRQAARRADKPASPERPGNHGPERNDRIRAAHRRLIAVGHESPVKHLAAEFSLSLRRIRQIVAEPKPAASRILPF